MRTLNRASSSDAPSPVTYMLIHQMHLTQMDDSCAYSRANARLRMGDLVIEAGAFKVGASSKDAQVRLAGWARLGARRRE